MKYILHVQVRIEGHEHVYSESTTVEAADMDEAYRKSYDLARDKIAEMREKYDSLKSPFYAKSEIMLASHEGSECL